MHNQMRAAGGAVLAVCVDPPKTNRRVVDKNKLPFDILSDADRSVIRAYGLTFHDPYGKGEISLPANFLIDREGRVAWRYLPRLVQDRADPAAVLREVDRLLRP